MRVPHVAAVAALLLVVGAGCATPKFKPLPAFDSAKDMPALAEPRCYYVEETDVAAMPQLVPFATVDWAWGQYYSKKSAVNAALKVVRKQTTPDVVMFAEAGTSYAGSTSSASAVPLSGGGAVAVGFSQPIYVNNIVGICCRLAPVSLGIRWNDSGMVNEMRESAKSSGMLEGDTIVSIDGAAVTFGAKWLNSPHYVRLMKHKVGDEVPVIWIRPGTGRMEGKLRLSENKPTYMDIEPVDLSSPKMTPD